MKILRTFTFVLLFLSTGFANPSRVLKTIVSEDMPAGTVVFKITPAKDINEYLSDATHISFEVYKIGTINEVVGLCNRIKYSNTKGVKDCAMGPAKGDYQSITIEVKKPKKKEWLIAVLKEAGIKTAKVDNGAVVEIDKL